jgi:hypothetical protein
MEMKIMNNKISAVILILFSAFADALIASYLLANDCTIKSCTFTFVGLVAIAFMFALLGGLQFGTILRKKR